MATQEEFKIITDMYSAVCGRALYKIELTVKDAYEKYGWENGSHLTGVYKKRFVEATRDINPLTYVNSDGVKEFMEDDNGNLVYDIRDACKMLSAIREISVYILT